MSEGVAAGTETISVESGTDFDAIGEDESGGAIPRLGEGSMIVVEAADRFGDVLIVAESGRHEHAHGLLDRAAREDEELQRVVERGGIGFARAHEILEEINIASPDVRLEEFFTGGHPVSVASHGVDFAIVAHHAEGLSERPSRESVGGETLVVERDPCLEIGVLQVTVERSEGRRHCKALVADKSSGKGRDIEVCYVLKLLFDLAAD